MIMKFKKAKDYIKYLDEQSGEAWSNDNELLSDAMEDFAKMYHEQQVKNCSIPDVSGCFSFAKYVNGWYEYADNTENGDVYNNVVTGRLMTEQQIFNEWLKLNNR